MPDEKFEYKYVYETGCGLKVYLLGHALIELQNCFIPENLKELKQKEGLLSFIKRCHCGQIGFPRMIHMNKDGKLNEVKYPDYTTERILCNDCYGNIKDS